MEHHAITTVEMWNDKTNNNFNNVKILNAIFVVCRVVKVLTKVHVLYEVLLTSHKMYYCQSFYTQIKQKIALNSLIEYGNCLNEMMI